MATCLLSTDEMYAADRAAVETGIPSLTLMANAGWQVARAIRQRFAPRPVAVLCGPGNNGGDGFVVARILDQWGWPVRVGLLGERARLSGDAAAMAAQWDGPIAQLSHTLLDRRPLVVDALFGAGLARPLEGTAHAIVEHLGHHRLDVVAIDVPSGLDGNTGQVLGAAARVELTVTFFRGKPGHALMPGRDLCGELVVADIGIPESVLAGIAPKTFLNQPDLWRDALPWPAGDGHKYDRGHLIVAGGGTMTGAARLVALAARRAGAGLATLCAPDAALATYRAGDPGTIVQPRAEWNALLGDKRRNAAVLGPGLGVGAETAKLVLSALGAGKDCVLDADALTSFAVDPAELWSTPGVKILTPHDGEFARLFSVRGDRLTRARQAAKESRAIVLLKGPDTVIASPDGRAAITTSAPPTLATGGSGDVLAGIVGGLLAQGMEPFLAACAGAWMHGRAALLHGEGLIAEDVISMLPSVWTALAEGREGATWTR
jgi:NAD(P)H-hydrate epimerase